MTASILRRDLVGWLSVGSLCLGSVLPAAGQSYSLPGRQYTSSDRFVSTSFFHWFTSGGGQLSGPWPPLEGRAQWTGEPEFWRRQVKDVMDASIDVLYIHLIPHMEQQRINLFKALRQLRAEGYDVPRTAPFLDPLITWDIMPPIDVSTTAGKDAFVGQYIRFFNQYFAENPDPQAATHLLHINGRVVLNTWHCNPGYVNNMNSLTRADVESRLAAAFGASWPTFNNGIYMVGTVNGVAPAFSDEKMYQFSNTAYVSTFRFNNRKTATMKAGYWDQNIRNPGIFFPREGGGPYVQAWQHLNLIRHGGNNLDGESLALPVYHAYVESWNEYDEGTGVYAADPGPPYIAPGNQSGNTDVWSSTNNPREYIESTAIHAAVFNGLRPREARIIGHTAPATVYPGEAFTVTVAVRNEGNAEWSNAAGHTLGRPGVVILESHFDAGPEGWTLVRNPFGTIGNTTFENGDWGSAHGWSGGGLRTRTGNVNNVIYINGASTAWSRTLQLDAETDVAINFKWRLFHPREFESDEFGEARFHLNGQPHGLGGQPYLARFSGGKGVHQDTGWQEYTLLTTLPEGQHTLEIGGYNNKKTETAEVVEVYLDDVVIMEVDPGPAFGPTRFLIDDAADEIPLYGGIFRGRPKAFACPLVAPMEVGSHTLRFQMLQESVAWFGERLDVPVRVRLRADLDDDGDVDQEDFGLLQSCFGERAPFPSGCADADINRDGRIDESDFTILYNCFSGPNVPAEPACGL